MHLTLQLLSRAHLEDVLIKDLVGPHSGQNDMAFIVLPCVHDACNTKEP